MFKPRREVKEEDGSEGHEIQEDGSGPGQGREKKMTIVQQQRSRQRMINGWPTTTTCNDDEVDEKKEKGK